MPVPEPLPMLPRWQCHKIVEGDRIVEVIMEGEQWRWRLACGITVDVSPALYARVPPEVYSANSGYYVVYDDGYESWSPAGAFEAGYSRLGSGEATDAGTDAD